MREKIDELAEKIEAFQISNKTEAEDFKRLYTGKNGAIQDLFEEFKLQSPEIKKELGSMLNSLKNKAQDKLTASVDQLDNSNTGISYDYSLPGTGFSLNNGHPLQEVNNEIISIFSRIGFGLSEGPEVEDDWYNFTALNFPEDHPARDMQDTFFVEGNERVVLRTHTSPVQVRSMLKQKPPIRIISPGRVYRCDSDATHSPVFHQVEGLYIDKQVSFADLKETLFYFVKSFFGKELQVRFRPSYFPFTEPSAEMDIGWAVNGQEKWMEILGCGMVDPNVLRFANIDPEVYQGYAFGVGVERMTMLRYQVRDIRAFYENDVRFLNQF